jgi:phosphatidate cytidylyltransferase
MTGTDPPPATPDRWADLQKRILSALVLVALAALAIWQGGLVFNLAACLVVGLMVWELAVMTPAVGPRGWDHALGALAALCLLAWDQLLPPGVVRWLVLVLPSALLWLTPRRDRAVLAGYALAVMAAGTGFIALRAEGVGLFLWLVLIVVASDTLGYFAGRILGGPKFWPAVSPKKTWSGTVAGWMGALAVGLGFALAGGPAWLVWLAPPLALAGQMGDIAESALKRRAGIKDSSRLIPGHGGVLDRFDALLGAMVALLLLRLLVPGAP